MPQRLLIVEPGSDPLELDLGALLNLSATYEQTTWDRVDTAVIMKNPPDLLIAVISSPAAAPTDFFQWVRRHNAPSPILAIVRPACDDTLVGLAAHSADEILFAPFPDRELRCRVHRLLGMTPGNDLGVSDVLRQLQSWGLLGEDPRFLDVAEKVVRVARSDVPVLLTGETGTGKELFARTIHRLSQRCSAPIVLLDCAGIPGQLLENELFGHTRGAFTSAHSEEKGLAAAADCSTLFIDEVDSLPHASQARLLRLVEERTYKPLGSPRCVRADIRAIAAANRDLEALMKQGDFRSDLYYRLNVARIHIPLRERRGDILLIARHFLQRICAAGGYGRKYFAPSVMAALEEGMCCNFRK